MIGFLEWLCDILGLTSDENHAFFYPELHEEKDPIWDSIYYPWRYNNYEKNRQTNS